MDTEPRTRFSQSLPPLQFSLSLLYVGRLLVGMGSSEVTPSDMNMVDEYIEAVTEELRSTELLHQAAVLAGDTLPENPPADPVQDDLNP